MIFSIASFLCGLTDLNLHVKKANKYIPVLEDPLYTRHWRKRPGVVAHRFSPSTQESEVGSEFQVSQGYIVRL